MCIRDSSLGIILGLVNFSLGNGNMAAFHHPLAYKTQITHFDRRFQVNPLRNGIGADIRDCLLYTSRRMPVPEPFL